MILLANWHHLWTTLYSNHRCPYQDLYKENSLPASVIIFIYSTTFKSVNLANYKLVLYYLSIWDRCLPITTFTLSSAVFIVFSIWDLSILRIILYKYISSKVFILRTSSCYVLSKLTISCSYHGCLHICLNHVYFFLLDVVLFVHLSKLLFPIQTFILFFLYLFLIIFLETLARVLHFYNFLLENFNC